MSGQNRPDTHPSVDRALRILWFAVCLAMLGFPAKYQKRLHQFERIRTGVKENETPWSSEPTYSDKGDPEKPQKTMRQKQQEEWDRLNIAVSVITATSAAALAIAATSPNSSIYWLVTAFYSIAFGLSLQGLILITYITIAAGGSSDEAIERLAKGELFSDWPIPVPFSQIISVRAAALVMALPAILATYSSISLLMGLVAMVCSGASGRGKGVETHQRQYALVTMIPVGVAFFFLCVAILLSEATVWIEIRGRENYRLKQKDLEEAGHGAETAEQSPTSPTNT